jgi:hypothetical protein
MNGEVVLDAARHTLAHYLREIDSAIRTVLEPMVGKKRRAEIKAMEKLTARCVRARATSASDRTGEVRSAFAEDPPARRGG